jgi:uncharacterized protein YbcI
VRSAPPRPDPTIPHIAENGPTRESLTRGQLKAALARSAVRVQSQFVGRGPTKAQAFFRQNFVVVVMQDTMTTSERSLAAGGQDEAVLHLRKEIQQLMREQLVAEVERLTGCRVLAFMSDSHIDPDVAAEVFVLDRSIPDDGPDAEPGEPG